MELFGRTLRSDLPVPGLGEWTPVWAVLALVALLGLWCLHRLARSRDELLQEVARRQREERRTLGRARELERSNRELEQFAATVSHDLRSPLRGVASLVEWIAADYAELLDEEGRAHLALVQERTVRMHRMIEGILEYSRSARSTDPCHSVDPTVLLRGVVEALAPPPDIEVRVEEPLPACFCNETQLSQVFQNLIGNALQHLGRPSGTITVRGRAEGDAVHFSVSDDGVGIPPEHQERIFRIFQTYAPGGQGSATGIGLSIVKKIVESHGGELALESAPGEGSTFHFTLPGEP